MHTYFPYMLALRCLNLYNGARSGTPAPPGWLLDLTPPPGWYCPRTNSEVVGRITTAMSQITDFAYVPRAEKACSGRARHHVDAHMISYYWQGLPMGTYYS